MKAPTTIWQIEPSKDGRFFAVEYRQSGKTHLSLLRKIGPVKKQVRLIGMLAKLLNAERQNLGA